MLRITMLKLRRTWSLALTLRNRGDARFTGKYHRLMKLRTAQKSTLSNKDDEWKCKQIIDYLFSPLRTHDEIRKIQSIIIGDIRRLQRAADKDERHPKKHRHINTEYSYEDCNRIISAIFGEHQTLKSGNICNAKEVNEQVELSLSTTAKQTEEQLAQKVEVINETPLVEAEKPKIEGFNTPPRVLGQNKKPHRKQYDSDTISVQHKFRSMVRRLEQNEIFSDVTPMMKGVVYSSDFSNQGRKSSGTSGERKQDEYDSIAERHLSTPNNELDNNLLKEMQKLGVPQVSGKHSTNFRVDSSKRPRKPSANDTELEACKCDHESTFGEEKHSELILQSSTNKKLQVSPPADHASRLHEDGMRFVKQSVQSLEVNTGKNESQSEKIQPSDAPKTSSRFANQRIQSSNIGVEKNENHAEKIPPSDQKNGSVQNDKVLFGTATVRQEAELPPGLSALQALTLLPQLYPWSFKKLSSKDHQDACMYSTERSPPYDPQKRIDLGDKKKDVTDEQKKDKNNPDSELVPNYEGLKLNRDKPYYDNISLSYSPSNFLSPHNCWPARHKYDHVANMSPYDQNSHRLYFNRNLPYYYNEKLPIPGTYYHKLNMWSMYTPNLSNDKEEHEIDETSNLTSHGLQFNRNMPYTQSPKKEEGLSKIIGQEDLSYLPAENEKGEHSADEHPRINSEGKTAEHYLNRDKPYCYNHHFPYSGCFKHQNIWLTAGNEAKYFQNKFHNIDPKLDLSQMSTDHCTNDSATDTKSDFVPETRDESTGPVERLQGDLVTATDTKEQFSSDQNIPPKFFYQYPWRIDYPYIKHQKATESAHAEANPDNIILHQNATEQPYEQTERDAEHQQHPFFHQLPWITPYQYTIPRETQEYKDDANPDNIVLDQHTSEPSYEEHSQEQEFPHSYQLHPWNNPYQYSVVQNSQSADVYDDSSPNNSILDQDIGTEPYDQAWTDPHQYSHQIQTVDERADDNVLFKQNTADPSFDEEQQVHPWMLQNTDFQQQEDQTADYVIPADDSGDPSFDEEQQVHPWMLQNTDFQQQEDQTADYIVPADENPDNIFLEQNTGDLFHGEGEQLQPWTSRNLSFQQQEFPTADYVIPADENPDDIFVEQNTGESNEDQELHPWTHPYQYSQRNFKPADNNLDNNELLKQDTDDSSHEKFLHEPYPNYTFTRTNRLEPLQTILHTANSNPIQGQSCHFPLDFTGTFHHYSGSFNQYPQYQSQSLNNYPHLERRQDLQDSPPILVNKDRRPPCDAHEPILDRRSNFDISTSTYLDNEKSKVFLQPVGIPQSPFYVKTPRFFPQVSIMQTPYFYHQSYTCFRELPSLKKYWQDEISRQHLEAPTESDQRMIVSDQETPIIAKAVEPVLSSTQENASCQASTASSAGFVTLPRVKEKTLQEPMPREILPKLKSNEKILPKPSPAEISPDEAVDFIYQENSLPQVEMPVLEDDLLPLSKVLRRVRRRSRLEFMSRFTQSDPVEGKCGKCGDPPPCPIPQPKCPPPAPCKPPCPPPTPPCPRPCKPKCPPPCVCPPPKCPPCPPPKPCCKFQALDDASPNICSVLWDLGSPNVIFGRLPSNYHFPQSAGSSKATLTESATSQLISIGNNLLTAYGSVLGNFCCKLENLANARGFEPWVPVPSWPIPVKEPKKTLVCPDEGCKQRPPPRRETPCAPPCTTGNPCLGFPNKYRKN